MCSRLPDMSLNHSLGGCSTDALRGPRSNQLARRQQSRRRRRRGRRTHAMPPCMPSAPLAPTRAPPDLPRLLQRWAGSQAAPRAAEQTSREMEETSAAPQPRAAHAQAAQRSAATWPDASEGMMTCATPVYRARGRGVQGDCHLNLASPGSPPTRSLSKIAQVPRHNTATYSTAFVPEHKQPICASTKLALTSI